MSVAVAPVLITPSRVEATDTRWHWLYKIGGAAAWLSVVFFPIQIAICLMSPPPNTVMGWFTLFQNNQLVGLLNLDLLLMVDQVLAILIFLALYVALRRANESFMAIAFALALVSATLFIASNPAFAMRSLSEQYAAGTETQRTLLLAAGQAVLVTWQGSAFQASYLLGSVAPIIMSVVMLQGRHRVFSQPTAYLGILSNVIALGLYVPKIGVYISIFSVVFLWMWYSLIARRLFQLGQLADGGAQ